MSPTVGLGLGRGVGSEGVGEERLDGVLVGGGGGTVGIKVTVAVLVGVYNGVIAADEVGVALRVKVGTLVLVLVAVNVGVDVGVLEGS